MIKKRGTAPADEEQFHEELWAYSGRRSPDDKQSVDRFVLLSDLNADKDAARFSTDVKRGRRFTVGGVYSVEVSEDGTKARIGGATFKRMLPDTFEKFVLSWKTQDDAARLTLDAIKLEAKGADMHLEILEPLRELYRNSMPMRQAAAIEVAVLRYLRRSKA